MSRRALLGGAIALTLLLSACTVTISPGPSLDLSLADVITEFRPTRGARATYYVGEQIEFLLNTRQPGYVTLTAIDPDGTVYVLSRNVYVPGGAVVLPTREQRVTYTAAPPRGFHRIRVAFTTESTPGNVVYRDRRGDREWAAAIRVELEPYEVRDVAETSLDIR